MNTWKVRQGLEASELSPEMPSTDTLCAELWVITCTFIFLFMCLLRTHPVSGTGLDFGMLS